LPNGCKCHVTVGLQLPFTKGLLLVVQDAASEHLEQRRNYKQLVSYAGYDVVKKKSGTSVKGKARISKKSNSHIRKALHFPAISAVKYNDPARQLYKRTLEKQGIKIKGYVAV
jgi:hypothetical protein